MQNSLFPVDAPPAPAAAGPAAAPATATRASRARQVQAVECPPALHALAAGLPPLLRLGTSSWSFPGWKGLVWDGDYSESMLAQRGLAAYARHPLLRTVSLDRAFYQPLTPAQYAAYAEQVPGDFRFVVKAPSVVADALVRAEDGKGMRANAAFLDPRLAWSAFVDPALQGLATKAGALVFQLSPLPVAMLARMPETIARLGAMLAALPPLAQLRERAPDLVIAVEVRDPEWLVPAFADALRAVGATYCLGGHAKMPPIEDQLPVLRALWPGPLVCRWNLHRSHGRYGYEDAKALYRPFDQLVDPDPQTRAVLARVLRATTGAGQPAYLTINNKAEGSAPRTVEAMARLLVP
ncbi:DUF72 domain-containing protein [Pseudorhodoferax sp. Leaf267]|uniref:DUF72 domain-containing protein n=1 Tax=Pseudorhodoferax sp. Leaf267 TaxID=1736316 RepID=UPI0006FE7130|nr:DUF72 domain-containing protein [Pseudorhodoferax sp. Leaf267]KQP11960.1 hypothetical protein ASF43_23745 [Pseudorhodoferax sp. Leaf267]